MGTSAAGERTGDAGYDPSHFAAIAAVEDRHFWFRARNRAIRAVVARLVSRLPRSPRVLEVGCGTGNTLRVMQETFGSRLVGMDLFSEGLRLARRRTGLPVVQARLEQPPFVGTFDLVGAFDVVEHIDDDAGAFRTLCHLTTPNGWLIVTVPAHEFLWSQFDEEACHVRRYGRAQLHERLDAAGYRIEYLTYLFATIYPFLRVARWLHRTRQDGFRSRSAVLEELRIIPVLNGVLSAALMVESMLVGCGATIPTGTSLLAVAQRR